MDDAATLVKGWVTLLVCVKPTAHHTTTDDDNSSLSSDFFFSLPSFGFRVENGVSVGGRQFTTIET